MDRSFRQNINKKTLDLNYTWGQMDPIKNIPSNSTRIYILLKHIWNILQDRLLGHKMCLSKFLKTEIKLSIFSDYSGIKLDINRKRKTGKFTNM